MSAAAAPASIAPAEYPLAAYVPPACRNCGVAMTGRFCPDCGQRAVVDRLTVGLLAADFASQFLSLDRGLWFTALAVLRDPGGVARRFVDGQRRTFVGPIGFLSFAGALTALAVRSMLGDTSTADSGRAFASGRHPLFSPRQAAAFSQLIHDLGQQEALSYLLIAVPFAVFVRRRFRRTGVTLAEAGVLSLYAFAAACLIYTPLVPLIAWLGGTPNDRAVLSLVVNVVAVVHAGRGFFDRRLATALRMVAVLATSFTLYILALIVSGMLYVALAVPR